MIMSEAWIEDIRRISNLIIGTDNKKKIICITGMKKVVLQKQICIILGKAIADRKKAVLLVHVEEDSREEASNKTALGAEEHNLNWEDIIFKGKDMDEVYALSGGRSSAELLGGGFADKLNWAKQLYDYIIVDSLAIEQQAEGTAIAAICDETLLLVEKGTMNGNRAMSLKRGLDMNNVHILGSIFIR